MKDPKEQFQIGDTVVYMPEGVITEIGGYLWQHAMGSEPFIQSYVLTCGITVPGSTIAKYRREASIDEFGLRRPRSGYHG